MSHKGKNAAKGKKPAKGGAESKAEDVLQAVVGIEFCPEIRQAVS